MAALFPIYREHLARQLASIQCLCVYQMAKTSHGEFVAIKRAGSAKRVLPSGQQPPRVCVCNVCVISQYILRPNSREFSALERKYSCFKLCNTITMVKLVILMSTTSRSSTNSPHGI